MDILYELSALLGGATDDLKKAGPEYRDLRRREESLLEKIEVRAGKDLMDRLSDAQEERMESERLLSFLWGLRLGVELLRL